MDNNWQESEDIKALPVHERTYLAVHNKGLGKTNLNEKHIDEIKRNVRPRT